MSTVSLPTHRAPAPAAAVWKAIALGLPLVIATAFFFVWRTQVNHLANRPLNSYGAVPPFQLVNQHCHPFGSAQLSGKIWIADFIFTACPGPCPMISSRMSELQKPLSDTDVQLVSFTVDPEKDTTEVLSGYAEKLHARPGRWDFLTGPKSKIYDISRNGFKLGVSDSSDGAGIPVHSTRMILVDRHGEIRGYYDATAADGVTKLLADTSHLLREQPK
jgi:cytochrome oxidase Cu insertion factor (SCO1/SenC/PrrC family)